MEQQIVENMFNAIKENEEWFDYLLSKRKVYSKCSNDYTDCSLVSETNWLLRHNYNSCEKMGLEIKPGDICFIDFGQAYLNEIGYQHFGLVLTINQKKAFIVPMTSNKNQYKAAFDNKNNPKGKKHLMQIGLIDGLVKPSVLFLNDCKFINTARIIDRKAHIDPESLLFITIKRRIMEIILDK